MFKRILLATDGSDRSLTAAAVAADLAVTHDAVLIVVHVCPIPALPEDFPGAPLIAQPLITTYVEQMHSAVLDRTLAAINEHGVFCETRRAIGEPVYAITTAAEAERADLIVIGSRGLSTNHAERMGSVSYGVVHRAHCPVLLVR